MPLKLRALESSGRASGAIPISMPTSPRRDPPRAYACFCSSPNVISAPGPDGRSVPAFWRPAVPSADDHGSIPGRLPRGCSVARHATRPRKPGASPGPRFAVALRRTVRRWSGRTWLRPMPGSVAAGRFQPRARTGDPPFDPARLRAAGYGPLIATMRRMMGAGIGVRIDHVMGLFASGGCARRPRSVGRRLRPPIRRGDARHLGSRACVRLRRGGRGPGTVESGVRSELHRAGCSRTGSRGLIAASDRYPTRRSRLDDSRSADRSGAWTGADLAEMEATGRRSAAEPSSAFAASWPARRCQRRRPGALVVERA